MLTIDEVKALAADLESFNVERKSAFKPVKSDIEEAICAFANDLPGTGRRGVLLIGVDDKRGNPTALPITDELLREITDIRSAGNILPLPMLTVYKSQLDGIDIAVVEVEPSHDTPVRLRGRVCVRVGPRRGTASREEERVLTERRRAADLPFDSRSVGGTTLAEVDELRLRQEYLPLAIDTDTLAENHRPLAYQLESLHLANAAGIPTVALLLLYGRDARARLPGAYVQFVRFDGLLDTDPIVAHQELNGSLPDVLRDAYRLVELNIRAALDPSNAPHIERPDYPIVALKQILANALMHRTYEVHAPVRIYWYSDRVEIESPGGLYGRVNEANFGQRGATDYRNPVLAAGLKILGFVQTFGMGIALARRRCAENGNPPPEFAFGPSHLLVTVRCAA